MPLQSRTAQGFTKAAVEIDLTLKGITEICRSRKKSAATV